MKRLGIAAAALALAACGKQEAAAPKAVAPAKVVPKEGDLTSITLTPEAEKRLGIKLAAVERKKIDRVRTLGGEVVAPPGTALTVSAPLGGTIAPTGKGVPQAGSAVRKGQPVVALAPILSPDAAANLAAARAEAEGAVGRAVAQREAAKVAFERAERLLRDKAGSVRAVDEARAELRISEASFKAAEGRRDALARLVGEAGGAAPWPIESPVDGLLRNIHVAAGQKVPSGAPLFEVLGGGPLWVRVAVYVGDVPALDAGAGARVGELSGRGETVPARALAAPPSADPGASSVDLFYEFAPKGHRPGQRVGVTIPLKETEENLTVPWAAILHDIHGTTWVYQRAAPLTFARRRVVVKYVVGDTAALAAGPTPGTEVVTDGAAELFGTEFGIGK